MSKHAEQRLEERFGVSNPAETLQVIQHAFQLGALVHVGEGASDADVYRFPLPCGRTAFPVITKGGVIKTIYTDGMVFTTSSGKIVLKSARITEDGIYQIAPDDYHADPCLEPALSASLAKLIVSRSPCHAWTASQRLNPCYEGTNKKHFDIGRAAHRAVLGKGERYIAIPKTLLASNGAASTKAAKEFIEEARADGLTPLKTEEIAAVDLMAEKIRDELGLHGVNIDPAYSEQVAVAHLGGIWNRVMIDYAPPGPNAPLYDIKTTTDASPDAVRRTLMSHDLQIQAQHYLEVWRAVTGEERAFLFVFVEKEAPHSVTMARIAAGTMVIGRKQISRARAMWRNCLDANDWPAYPHGILEIDFPEYWAERWLERESAEADLKNRTGVDVLEHARQWQAPQNHAAE